MKMRRKIKMKIIPSKEKLAEMFEKMDTDKILVDMLETRKEWLQYAGTTSSYYWLEVRYKVALVEIVKREFE